ncbi:MAG: hypothetical protein KDA58_05140 [Planctomycetaceae bacterium]|nr:hypothetical protein [Planctomycetaceae bacterium]
MRPTPHLQHKFIGEVPRLIVEVPGIPRLCLRNELIHCQFSLEQKWSQAIQLKHLVTKNSHNGLITAQDVWANEKGDPTSSVMDEIF